MEKCVKVIPKCEERNLFHKQCSICLIKKKYASPFKRKFLIDPVTSVCGSDIK